MPEPFLRIRGLQMHFAARGGVLPGLLTAPGHAIRAVDGVDLALDRGEALGLVGESGCGKSTLARCIVGLHDPTAGEIEFDGRILRAKRDRATRRRIQMVFQDPYSSLNPRLSVRRILAELLRVHRVVPRERVEERCRELVELVGLAPSALEAYPRQLSGGQRQRVSIARALALEPDVLVADEPVSALDVSVQATILNLLAELRRDLGLTLILITHDMAVVRHVAERVAVMYLGRIVETAATEVLFSDPRHPYTRGLIDSVPLLRPGQKRRRTRLTGDPPSAVDIPSGCRFRKRCPIAQPNCADIDPDLMAIRDGAEHRAACLYADRREAIAPLPRT
ncbi:MAG: ABC transporter ATP-binding protein [Actinomycetota bacterium]|nr:ABC transporter ATP-binding protein [Actinomycetota bacterium]